jgi:hypothetical protein
MKHSKCDVTNCNEEWDRSFSYEDGAWFFFCNNHAKNGARDLIEEEE